VRDETEILLAFQRAIEARHIIAPRHLVGDGKLHRCDAAGRNGKKDAAYILFLDNIPAGGFENHRDGRGWETWHADIERQLSKAERDQHKRRMAEARAQRDADDRERKAEARSRADAIWRSAVTECNGFPYLEQKHIGPHGARLYRGRLVVPVLDLDERQQAVPD
jgi:putative DNA primase/helicase